MNPTQHAITINFDDTAENDRACVIVRYNESHVYLAVSLRKDGDIAVCMSKDEANKLIEGLKSAVA